MSRGKSGIGAAVRLACAVILGASCAYAQDAGVAKQKPGRQRGAEKKKEARGKDSERAPGVEQVLYVTGTLSKSEKTRRGKEGGEEIVGGEYYLTDAEGNRITLPTPRADRGGSIPVADYEALVGKVVTVDGFGVVRKLIQFREVKSIIPVAPPPADVEAQTAEKDPPDLKPTEQ